MDIDKRVDGVNLCAGGNLWLGTALRRVSPIGAVTRIGITRDIQRPYRFYERGNPFVSGPKRLLKGIA
jgi:DNA-3-methyladenine glycosylase